MYVLRKRWWMNAVKDLDGQWLTSRWSEEEAYTRQQLPNASHECVSSFSKLHINTEPSNGFNKLLFVFIESSLLWLVLYIKYIFCLLNNKSAAQLKPELLVPYRTGLVKNKQEILSLPNHIARDGLVTRLFGLQDFELSLLLNRFALYVPL